MSESQRTIPDLSPGLTADFQRAIEQTGWTPQLSRAAVILPRILRMSPDEFERATKELYQRM